MTKISQQEGLIAIAFDERNTRLKEDNVSAK